MLNSKNETKYPVIELIHELSLHLISYYLSKHSKMLPVRFDVHYPSNITVRLNNTDISRCTAKVILKFKRKGLDPAYIWVREQNESHNPHYHFLMILNGHKSQSAYLIFNTFEKLWASTLKIVSAKGLIHYCLVNKRNIPHTNGKLVKRSEGVPEYVRRQISYMAKPSGKGQAHDGIRDFGMTRIPREYLDRQVIQDGIGNVQRLRQKGLLPCQTLQG